MLFNIVYGILSMHRSSLSNSEGPVSIHGGGEGGGGGLPCAVGSTALLGPARPALLGPACPALLGPAGPPCSTWPSPPFSAQHTYTMLTHTCHSISNPLEVYCKNIKCTHIPIINFNSARYWFAMLFCSKLQYLDKKIVESEKVNKGSLKVLQTS